MVESFRDKDLKQMIKVEQGEIVKTFKWIPVNQVKS